MDIYWIQDKQRRGPATAPDVISLVQMGELQPETLGWHAGCKGWKPLRELPALADFLNDSHTGKSLTEGSQMVEIPVEEGYAERGASNHKNASSPQDETQSGDTQHQEQSQKAFSAEQSDVQRIYLPRPAVRLLARMVDCAIYAVIAMGLMHVCQTPFSEYLLPFNSLFWAPLVLLEALCVSKWRTTPGKALMGIKIRTFGPDKSMTFGRALSRSISVYILGVGMFLPFFAIVTMILSYFMLTRKGVTLWDARALTLPAAQAPLQPLRLVSGMIALILALQLTGYMMKPWWPNIVQTIEKESPEAGQKLREMLQQNGVETGSPAKEQQKDIPQPLS